MNIRNFANLTMWGLVALSLVVSTVGTVAELEPLEHNCLLQTKESKEQQLVVQEQTQGAWTAPPGTGDVLYCGGDCQCEATGPSFQLSLENCQNRCSGSPGFN